MLESQCAGWSALRLTYLRTSGTSNAMWRLHVPDGRDLVVRLPRQESTAATIAYELDLLDALADASLPVELPVVRHRGQPNGVFPYQWGVLEWLDGADAWSTRDEPHEALAIDVAAVVRAIGCLDGMPARRRPAGHRGGPIDALNERLHGWLHDPRWCAASLVDIAAVERSAAESLEAADEPVDVGFVHGDLIPGNLLVSDGRLRAVIDWGDAAHADLAQDLAPAWAVFDGRSRAVFREAVGADDAAWLRARLFELEHAVCGVLYYTSRRHELGDVMARTLHRILDDTV